jgi:predicted nucleic acid-binding protein
LIVLDTTILVYAVGEQHALAEPCRRLVEAIRNGRVTATTTVEVIQEFAHVRARRRDKQDAAGVARDFVELLSPLLVVTQDVLTAGLRLFERTALGSFDAVLAAAAIDARASSLMSADGAFEGIRGLKWVDPRSAAFDEL